MVQKADGDYDGALQSLRRGRAPSIRATAWCSTRSARILFLKRDYAEAVAVLKQVCDVDPEDVQMHYTLMLCYRGLGDARQAAREEKLFRRFKADEASQAITGERRRQQPEDNNERQQIHDHESVPSQGIAVKRNLTLAGDTAGCPARFRKRCGTSAVSLPSFCLARAATLPQRRTGTFTDVTAPAGIKFATTAAGPGRSICRRPWAPAARSSMPMATAGRTSCSINSKDWTPRGRKSLPALYRNNRNGTFTNITAGSGLDVEMYGMGVAIADYDNDGRDDVYITALEGDRLFHNEGNGKFRDVTKASGIRNANFGTSAAWLDYDRDGKLDLFVANYVQWTPTERSVVLARWRDEIVLHARILQGHARRRLYHNLGGGKFEDVSRSGRRRRPDQQVARRDRVRLQQRRLAGYLRGQRHAAQQAVSQQQERHVSPKSGMAAGVAFGEDGVARGAMGADAGDYDRSRPPAPAGRQFLQPDARPVSQRRQRAVRGRSAALRRWAAPACCRWLSACSSSTTIWTAIPTSSRPTATSRRRSAACSPRCRYTEPPLLFRNLGNRKFENVSAQMGAAFNAPIVARGAAYADFDRDGDLDVLITTNHGPAYLFRNDGGNRNHWLNVRLAGTKSNRDGIGAVVRVESRRGKQWSMVRSGSSYCSQSDLALTFGLGKDTTVSAGSGVAERRAPAIRQRARRPVPHHRRNARHRQALRFVGQVANLRPIGNRPKAAVTNRTRRKAD